MPSYVADTIEPMSGTGSFPVVSASNVSGLATVATTGDYNDLINTPGGGGGTNSEYAQKIGTDSSHPAIGNQGKPVYINDWGSPKEVSKIEFNSDDCSLTPRTGGEQLTTRYIGTNWANHEDGYEFYGYDAWVYLTVWRSVQITDQFRLVLDGTEYHLDTVISSTDIQEFCPNAQSASINYGYHFLDSNDNVLTGVGLVSLYSFYAIVADYVLFTGTTYPSDFDGATTTNYSNAEVVKSTAKANIVHVKQVKDLETINSKNNRVTLTADHNSNVNTIYKSLLQDTEEGFHQAEVDIAFDEPVTITIGGSSYTGIWYNRDTTYPGYISITGVDNYYGGGWSYCYFTDKVAIMLYNNTNSYLLVDSSIYSTLTEYDTLIVTRNSVDGNLTFKGHITVTSDDTITENNKGKISANIVEAPKLLGLNYINNSHRINLYDNTVTLLDSLQDRVTTITESSIDYYATNPEAASYEFNLYGQLITVYMDGGNYTGTWSYSSQATTSLIPPSYLTHVNSYYYINEHMLIVQLYNNGKYQISFCCDSTIQNNFSYGYINMITRDGHLVVKGSLTLTGYDSDESNLGRLTANSINCHNTYIYKKDNPEARSTNVNLADYPYWSTYKSCWECGYPAPLVTNDDWSSDRKAELYLYGLSSEYQTSSFYADRSEVRTCNLQDYCPNAESYSIVGFPIKYWDSSEQMYKNVTGMCMSEATGSRSGYILWIDSTLYTASESGQSLPDVIKNYYSYAYFYCNLEYDPAYIQTQELHTNKLNVNSKINTYNYGTKYEENYLTSYKSELSYYSSWNCYRTDNIFNTYSITRGKPYAIYMNGVYYQGTWYDADEGPGYSTVTSNSNSYPYCYFNSNAVLLCTSTNNIRLLVNSTAYSDLVTDSDGFYSLIQVPTNDGRIEINGVLQVTGSDSYEKGTIYCSKIIKNQYGENQNMEIQAAIKLPMRIEGEELASYWEATSSGLYTCTKEIDIAPFDYVYIYWDSVDVSYTSVTITADDWWIDSSNNAFGFNVFNNTGADAKPISVWYNTTTHLFKMWEDAQTGNAIPTSMYISYSKTNGVTTRTVIQNTDDGNYITSRKTIATPGCMVMTDSQSGLVIKPDQIRVGNPGDSTGTTVTINRNSITIGNTTINEAQLQALLAMITNPPAPATLGVMSIVE